MDTLAQAVAPEGTIYLYGLLSEQPNSYPVSAFLKAISLTGYMMYQMTTPERFGPMKRYVYEHLTNGSCKPHVDRIFPFEQAADAYRYLESQSAGRQGRHYALRRGSSKASRYFRLHCSTTSSIPVTRS